MQTIHCTGSEPLIRDIARVAFPAYTGAKFQLVIHDGTVNCASYWDGGSRSYFVFVRLGDLHASAQAPAQSAFDPTVRGLDAVPMTPGVACVEHVIFCGKDLGLRIHIHPDNAAPLLPAPVEATWAERVVLASMGLKNSYAGRKDNRRHEAIGQARITGPEYDAAFAACVARDWIKKVGAGYALTIAGRNVPTGGQLWALKRAAEVA